jgi:energy-coupling factor transporter ATP-binding protein EcfA2
VSQNANGHSKFIGLDRKIFEMEKKLQHVSTLGIIGMGGIGKSTLAKALSGHISHRFDVTCFLNDFTDVACTILLQYKSRPINVRVETKALREGREILEQLQKTQKVLIVLDNVGNSSQLDELLGDHKFGDVNGSRLIASSRDWKSLKRHVPILGRVNMQLLDEGQSTELFSMQAFTTNEPCLPYLEHVSEKIVSACNGLPLSLEVMGTILHGEKRLRVWEDLIEP